MESEMKVISRLVTSQETKIRRLMSLVIDVHKKTHTGETSSSDPPADSPKLHPERSVKMLVTEADGGEA